MKGKVKNIILTVALAVVTFFMVYVLVAFNDFGGTVNSAGEVVVDVVKLIFAISFTAIAGFGSLLGLVFSLTNLKHESKGVRIYSYFLDFGFAAIMVIALIEVFAF